MSKTLEEYVREKSGGKVRYDVLEEVYYNILEGKVRIRDPNPPADFITYLSRPAYNLWLYTGVVLATLTVVVVFLSESFPWLLPLRYVLGAVYVLFLPGYSLVEALYPEEGRFSDLEKLALSIGLSLAVVPLLGLVLNYTPWGISLGPYIVSSYFMIVSLLFVGAYRRFRLLAARRRVSHGL